MASAGIAVALKLRMSNYRYGVILGYVAIAIVAWKWAQSRPGAKVERERGEVIFSNTPQA
jgi:hypothetical protein